MAKKKTLSKPNKRNDIMPQLKMEFERHTNVLMEKLDSTVKTVTEQYSNVIKKIDELRSDGDELKNDMAIVKPAVEANSRDLNEVKSELDSVGMAVKELDKKTDRIEQKLDTVTIDHEERIKRLELVR